MRKSWKNESDLEKLELLWLRISKKSKKNSNDGEDAKRLKENDKKFEKGKPRGKRQSQYLEKFDKKITWSSNLLILERHSRFPRSTGEIPMTKVIVCFIKKLLLLSSSS